MIAQLARTAPLMLCQDCLQVRPYCEFGHFGYYRCDCGGDFCGCTSCNDFAHGQGADFAKRQALEAANEKPEPVRSPAACRQLRLLCVLVPTRDGSTRSLPVHTMHRVPPRAPLKGFIDRVLASEAGFHLRETQATAPTASVLERCLPKLHLRANGRVSVLGVNA